MDYTQALAKLSKLQSLKEYFNEVAGSWNGEDDKFIHDRTIYYEEDGHTAHEIAFHIDTIEKLVDTFYKQN